MKISSKPIISVDFDGVIHKYSKGWNDGSIYDEPMPGCIEAMKKLAKKYRILIYSTRNYSRTVKGKKQKDQVKEIKKYLDKFDIPYDEIYTKPNKPICELFIDDNAYRFVNWNKTMKEIDQFL